MRIIDADALGVGRCNPDVMLDRAYAAGWNGIINIINDAPTIDPIRVAGGCRCGECKHYSAAVMKCFKPVDDEHTFHDYAPNIWKPNDFCSYGEPRRGRMNIHKRGDGCVWL